ncbi:uncharacterized protein LOC110718065 [Chenopodium quinoa]|uniref:uncharacterized protein LOC110718065 n=1 Tax=Chenopodium quinoa TaxID=63459 RepID=UPI000B774B5B|nr:uncharacterized protein LOC110718065 [Chenopodium quinoa]
MEESHNTPYSVLPRGDKLCKDLKREVAEFVSKCLTCQKVKIDHKRPMGKVQPLEIPSWKWDSISMDFVTGLARSKSGNDTIWVIVDRLTKSAVFIPVLSLKRARLHLNHNSLLITVARPQIVDLVSVVGLRWYLVDELQVVREKGSLVRCLYLMADDQERNCGI